MIRAILFDCFGVLVTDVLELIRKEARSTDPQGASEIDGLVRSANLGILSRDESNKRVAEILGITVEQYRSRITEGEVRDEKLFEYILELKKQYKTAMLSNISKESLQRRFTDTELNKYFDVVVTSGEVGFVKPSAEIYEIAADRLGLRCDECLFVDDRERFVEGAKAVGMQSFVYEDFTQFRSELEKYLK